MADGKVATIFSEVTDATTSCSICGLISSNLNDLEVYRTAADHPDIRFKYGLSTLHLWIKSMDCFLHIAYSLDFKKWQARGGNKEGCTQDVGTQSSGCKYKGHSSWIPVKGATGVL